MMHISRFLRNLLTTLIATALCFAAFYPAATAPDTSPKFGVRLYTGYLDGYFWTPDGNLQIEVFDFPGGSLIAGPLIVQAGSDGYFSASNVSFFIPGMFARVTDLTTSVVKELTLQSIEITSIDSAAEEVRGTAPAFAPVTVIAGESGSLEETLCFTDGTGTWIASFAGLLDIQPHHVAAAWYYDEDGDHVQDGRQYLHLQGGYDWDWMEFYYFSPANVIDYQVLNDQGDQLASGQIQTDARGWGYINKDNHGIELLPGYQIVALDQRRNISDTITMQAISTNAVDYGLNYVAGTAPPDIDLRLLVGIEGGGLASIHHFDIHSDINGNWSADLLAQFGYEMTFDTWIYAELSDENSNTTFAALDQDGDESINGYDNARLSFNPDQSDLDGDGVGDVEDPCPANYENTCNANRSGAVSIGSSGGTLQTATGDTSIMVPAGSLASQTSISITDTGEKYVLSNQAIENLTAAAERWAIFSNVIGPPSLSTAVPVTITLTWEDVDNNDIVDGTGVAESGLFIQLNETAATGNCEIDPGCSPLNNRFVFTTAVFGDLALVGDVVHYSLFMPVIIR